MDLLTLFAALSAGTLLIVSAGIILRVRQVTSSSQTNTYDDEALTLAEAHDEANQIMTQARHDAITWHEARLEEFNARQEAVEAIEAQLAPQDKQVRDLQQHVSEHRYSLRQRRNAIENEQAALAQKLEQTTATVIQLANTGHDTAVSEVLLRIENELGTEHNERVAHGVEYHTNNLVARAKKRISDGIQRYSGSHIDNAPRIGPLDFEGFSLEDKDKLVASLTEIANETNMEMGVDDERHQVTLRGIDPVNRELAREVSLEVSERKLSVQDVHPLLINTKRSLSKRISELGERTLWEMQMTGRPELAELVGTLHYRFSYGQNALLHCKEAGYLCGLLGAELGMDYQMARRAGMLHDIGKAVDHDIEGSHAIIGGELLEVFGTPGDLVHAVKAHHFDEEPVTDLALLTICADAISASRTGARRDTLTAYLARLEQLQEIATRYEGVDRAFPLQAGREVRISVKPDAVSDSQMSELCSEIARAIEQEMNYPGVIKVMAIRSTAATAMVKSGQPTPELLNVPSKDRSGKTKSRRRQPANSNDDSEK